MPNEAKRTEIPPLRLLVLITTTKLADKAAALFRQHGMPLEYRLHAQGTAQDEMLEVLGLGGTERIMLLGFAPQPFAKQMLYKLQTELKLPRATTGIACTLALSGASSLLVQILTTPGNGAAPEKEGEVMHMADIHYSMILAIVDQGYSEQVMEAARPAGAAGGTVINSRALANEEAIHFRNISVQPEKELVLILTENGKKHAIMQAIGDRCGVKSPAHGMLVSMPVEDIIGLDG